MRLRRHICFLIGCLVLLGSFSLTGIAYADLCGYEWYGDWHSNSHGYQYQEHLTCHLSEHEEQFRYTNDNKHEVFIEHEAYYSTSTGNYPRSCIQVLSEEECSPVPVPGYAATCTQSGLTDGEKCFFCGHIIIEQQEIPIKGHKRVVDQYLAPTCTKDGHTVGAHCSECGKVLVAYDVLPATGHTIVDDPRVEPTCTEPGSTAGSHCSVCGENFDKEIIPALNHIVIVDVEAIPATCIQEGASEISHCARCNAILSNAETIPALDHDLVHHDAKDVTCTATGWDAYDTCTRCDYTTYVEKAALDHDYVHHDAQAPTCTAIGWNAYDTCTRCDYTTYVEQAALGHDDPMTHTEAKAATCTAEGNTEYWHCSKCDKYFSDEEAETEIALADTVIGALGHDDPMAHTEAKAATCTAEGNTEYWHCSKCDKYFSDEAAEHEIALADTVIGALGHSWNDAEYEWAADHSTVTATHTCKNDESHTETEPVDVTAVIVAPTEDTEGSANYTSNEFTNDAFSVQTKSITIPALKDMSVMRLPNMLSTIENEAFSNLACQAIIIPDNCTTIGEYAFAGCTNLLYVKIPASVKNYPANAFEGCNANLVIDWAKE